jgi:hypothetical protein
MRRSNPRTYCPIQGAERHRARPLYAAVLCDETATTHDGRRGDVDESRRDLIKKVGVAGGIVWATPVIESVTRAASAAGTPAPTTSSPSTTIPVCAFDVTLLDGTQEVPPNSSLGQGTATITFDQGSLQLCIGLTFANLTSGTTAAHIHGPAPRGVNAPILFPLPIDLGVTSGNMPPVCFTLTAAQRDQLCAGLFYVNIHTSNFPAGEIRGQIEPT